MTSGFSCFYRLFGQNWKKIRNLRLKENCLYRIVVVHVVCFVLSYLTTMYLLHDFVMFLLSSGADPGGAPGARAPP